MTCFKLLFIFSAARRATRSGLILLIVLLTSPLVFGQQDSPDYFELDVEINIPRLGIFEIPVAIKDQQAYLPVHELYEILKIKHEESSSGIQGFIIHPDSTYQINFEGNEIWYRNHRFSLPDSDYIETPTAKYLSSNYFGDIFGLHTDFSFRSLSVAMKTDKELPVIKAKRLQKMRDNLEQVKGVVTPDTLVPRSYPLFKPGMLDWGLLSTQQNDVLDDNRLLLGLGSMFLGGETNLRLNYSTRQPFRSRNQFYQWRHINNESLLFKQITAGRIYTRATSSLFAPVSGIQLSNSPMKNRRSFGTYTLSDYTEARWTVELYVNNVLVDFTQADATGFYTFEVPLMYGSTNVSLRFYGPYGEERVEERIISIPYHFVPNKELEYTFSAGVVENKDWNRFSRLNMNYGLSNRITIGGGVEYLSEVSSGEVMPFVNSSVRLASNLLFSGEYTYGVKGEGILSYRSPRNLQVDLNYVRYHEEQTAINFNYLEERKISLSAPIRTRSFSMFARLSLNQIIMPTTEFTTAQLLLTGAIMGISTNLTTYGLYNDRTDGPTIYSSLSQNYRLPYRFLFSPQLQYDFSRSRLNSLSLELERSVFDRGYLNFSYENNFLRDAHIFELGLRYRFNFAQTAITSRIGNKNSSFVESASGSILFDDNTNTVRLNSRSSLGRAALTIIPFLDLNQNGVKEPVEPGVPNIELRNRSGRVSYNEDRTILWITELQPYQDILLEIDPVSLDNIAWKIPDPLIAVHTMPNHFQEVQVPVQVLGETAGMVYFKDEGIVRGQGRIIINILDERGQKAASILSEGDGYFTYLGLAPGKYTAVIDGDQLKNLGYKATPEKISFEIEVSEYGDIVDTLEFLIEPKSSSEISSVARTESAVKETEETKIPGNPKQVLLIDLGDRGIYAFSDTDENIRIIQEVLKELGYQSGPADGIYGKKTLQAVRRFQRDSKIRLDGIFGPQTLQALQERFENQL